MFTLARVTGAAGSGRERRSRTRKAASAPNGTGTTKAQKRRAVAGGSWLTIATGPLESAPAIVSETTDEPCRTVSGYAADASA